MNPLESFDATTLFQFKVMDLALNSYAISLSVNESLIDPSDGHLGYTQIVRLFELARYCAAESQDSVLEQNDTLRYLELNCLNPIHVGRYTLEWDPPVRGRRTSIQFHSRIVNSESALLYASVKMVLCSPPEDRHGS